MPLNDVTCKNAKPSDKPLKLSDSGGLFLKVMPSGGKYWQWKYRYMGKEKLLSFGTYPQVPLIEAREKRDAARKLLAAGDDPAIVKKRQKQVAKLNSENSFMAVSKEWHQRQAGSWTASHAKTIIKRLENDIFPLIGHYPINDITPPEVLDAVRTIEKRGAHDVAQRALQTTGQIFRYAIATGRAKHNPASELRGALTPVRKTHFAAIDINELPEFLQDLIQHSPRMHVYTRHAMWLIMYTFVRTTELIEASWEEIDFDGKQWVIPAERMKMRKEHIVPLSKQVIVILKELQQINGQWPWVLPNQVRPAKAMSNNTILKTLGRMGYTGRMTGHGFRALAMSGIKEKLGYRHEVVDRQLAHAPRTQVQAAYDRAKFLDERAVMMQQWADYIDGLRS